MKNWTRQELLGKLDEGWLLSGDVGSDVTFRIINPGQNRVDLAFGVDAAIVREFHEHGMLAPLPVPGKKMMYRRKPG
jgi:hypothetical protein